MSEQYGDDTSWNRTNHCTQKNKFSQIRREGRLKSLCKMPVRPHPPTSVKNPPITRIPHPRASFSRSSCEAGFIKSPLTEVSDKSLETKAMTRHSTPNSFKPVIWFNRSSETVHQPARFQPVCYRARRRLWFLPREPGYSFL